MAFPLSWDNEVAIWKDHSTHLMSSSLGLLSISIFQSVVNQIPRTGFVQVERLSAVGEGYAEGMAGKSSAVGFAVSSIRGFL